ncbi:MAG: hypothetical protein A2Y33_06635 [Spirochaetes bacterium GWF1_51_8]|nr:MAG: hypothetical protein A2Y33_06635 [Spirochaetes bacterium GWF1_51_8]
MSETLAKMTKCFGSYTVPEMLRELCVFWDKYPDYFSGSIEIEADNYGGVKEWFGNKEAGYSRVLAFAADDTGSLAGFWLYKDGMTPYNAPIVFLSSDMTGSTVIADSLSDYLEILTANRDFDPEDGEFYEFDDEQSDDNLRYRKWLKSKFGISSTDNPEALLEKAKSRHPDFEKWAGSLDQNWI